ncbi:MAG TPA: DUF3141 domain-containing protein [Burkholderiaceae bacterium]|nr:DUF3141 domain-containing protein [Burkholderiaceae bacterium]
MQDPSKQLLRAQDLASKVGRLYETRTRIAQEHFTEQVQQTWEKNRPLAQGASLNPFDWWQGWSQYAVDFAQRSVLFWDTLRQRGNAYLAHEEAGNPPVLFFEHEVVVDGRAFERPVNYVLLRIIPPSGVTVDPKRRPYLIIDPRAGHGPGIGGFKDDSQVGVALREGHPVYFVSFFPNPMPGQTLLDVCEAETRFVRKVRELHPNSAKPAIVGNCQGGWAAMMLAASNPDDTGPIVINGAPMSYWGGAWREGEGDNPMRYAGGMLGGSWLASLTADLGNGVFDGAWLVQNFENLNPANTFFDKYYHVFANVDTEPPRFLEFERWWGGFYLLNKEEIEWIVRNLFVGNRLWTDGERVGQGGVFDLRDIKSPIIVFASMGDNITPPQQAFNWVADIYGTTDEIKARGQVIVGLLHENIGHLGIFVSGKVAKKEHTQIVSVMKSIEALPAGLYGMQIHEIKGKDGAVAYEVEFHERSLEEIGARLNRFKREDEKPFEVVRAVSDFNQHAYELFAQPLIKAMSNEYSASLLRKFHPLRLQRWAFSDLNPWLRWLEPAAQMVKANRQTMNADEAPRRFERVGADLWSACLDYYRAMRDAASETGFFQTYGNMYSVYLADKYEARPAERAIANPRELPVVREALAKITEGGYAEALARIGALLAHIGEPLPVETLHSKRELMEEYGQYLPQLSDEERRRVRGEQDIIVRYEPELALTTLPQLLSQASERTKLLALVQRLSADERFRRAQRTPEQTAMLERILSALQVDRPKLAA